MPKRLKEEAVLVAARYLISLGKSSEAEGLVVAERPDLLSRVQAEVAWEEMMSLPGEDSSASPPWPLPRSK